MPTAKLKDNQVKIGGRIYTKGVTAVLYEGEYYPKKDIVYDTYKRDFNHISNVEAYIDIIDRGSKHTSFPVIVYINGSPYKSCKSFVESNVEFITHPEFVMSPANKYVYISKFDKNISTTSKYSPDSKVYNISRYRRPLPTLNQVHNKLSWIDYTYGFEIETSQGRISEYYANSLGFANLYDGSINGVEYVSKVMNTSNLHYLHQFITGAKVVTNADRFCSFHIHIGNIPKTDENLLSMYLLFQRLSDELNQLIVPYKKDLSFLSEKLRVNGRDHCKNLPRLVFKEAEEIYKLFKIGKYFNSDYKEDELMNYIDSTNKWNIEGRYYNVNFMNYICKGSDNNTVEIRSLQSTYNFDYIITWLLINTAIIDYAINNTDKVINSKEKIELNDCIEYYIKDKDIVKILLDNITVLKNFFYNQYYLNNNSLTDISSLDSYLERILVPYNIVMTNNISFKDSVIYKHFSTTSSIINNINSLTQSLDNIRNEEDEEDEEYPDDDDEYDEFDD